MTPESVMVVGQHAMQTMLYVSAPMLIAALGIGLIISIFQAATQINETTLTFIPKLVGLCVVLVLSGHWMITMLLDFMRHMIVNIPGMIG